MEQEEGGRSWIQMEEEEEEGWITAKPPIGFVGTAEGQPGEPQRPSPRVPEVVADLVRS